jgi:hypothetical protein
MNTKLQLLVRRAKLKFARVLFLKSFYRTTVIYKVDESSFFAKTTKKENTNKLMFNILIG